MSDTDPQALANRWNEFVGELTLIWDELGMESGVRNTHLQDVSREIGDFLTERVRQVRNVRDLARRTISTRSSKIALIYKQLGYNETKAHEFISEHTGPSVSLLQSQDALSRHLEELIAERKKMIAELVSVLKDVFGMEAELGETSGALELFCELQSESYDETHANTFRNNPAIIDEDTLRQVPETLERMRQVMARTKQLCESRQETLDELEASIVAFCTDLGADRNAYRNASVLQHPSLSLRRIEAIGAVQRQVLALRERRSAILHELANKLRLVWDQLQIPAEHRNAFINQNKGRSMEVIKACQDELDRVEALKAVKIRELILILRDRIHAAWEALSVTTIERKMFEDRYNYEADATFTDEALAAHKVLANSLEEMVLLSEPIIAKIKEHMSLLDEKATYDELTKNGDRLRDRKYSMKNEESLRKRVSKLPSLSEALIVELARWKAQNNAQPFLFNGIDYLQFLLAERARADEEKAVRQLRRGISGAPSSRPQPASSSLPPTTPSRKTSHGSSTLAVSSGLPTPSRPASKSFHSTSSLEVNGASVQTPARPKKPTSNPLSTDANTTLQTPARNRPVQQNAPSQTVPVPSTEDSSSNANTTNGTKSSSKNSNSENQEQLNK